MNIFSPNLDFNPFSSSFENKFPVKYENNFPETWTEEANGHVVEVGHLTAEFEQIEKWFCKSHMDPLKYIISGIYRIQNEATYEEFSLCKKRLSKEIGFQNLNIKRLFHGTTHDAVDKIINNSFDWRLYGRNGTAYGKGSYFATKSSYSCNYCPRGPNGIKSMFVASVITGWPTKGDASIIREPEGFHCTVDDVNSPNIYVIYHSKQAYPEYLINFFDTSSKDLKDSMSHQFISLWCQLMQQRYQHLLLLMHVSKCISENCPAAQQCKIMKQLWLHSCNCTDGLCQILGCELSKQLHHHFRTCKIWDCMLCASTAGELYLQVIQKNVVPVADNEDLRFDTFEPQDLSADTCVTTFLSQASPTNFLKTEESEQQQKISSKRQHHTLGQSYDSDCDGSVPVLKKANCEKIPQQAAQNFTTVFQDHGSDADAGNNDSKSEINAAISNYARQHSSSESIDIHSSDDEDCCIVVENPYKPEPETILIDDDEECPDEDMPPSKKIADGFDAQLYDSSKENSFSTEDNVLMQSPTRDAENAANLSQVVSNDGTVLFTSSDSKDSLCICGLNDGCYCFTGLFS